MIDREPLERLQAEWGGRIYESSQGAPRRDTYIWRLCSRQAAAFLGDIEPHVAADRVRRKIEFALIFQSQKRPIGRKPDPVYAARQEEFYIKMRQLNQRGVRESVQKEAS